ncbi:hypothetical protein N7603_05780 [Acholeplasma vituli]|uniref:Uncharacterized protein n=1 Tax=Paracholeplasma vituli TaxID=69473 RepID=A0ABT2PW50_9MOLU|nr:hypothetical protein [Paracholeplasma vituli]MCU0105162.1 hypothetical protein [Paracholeplasma vituli]
MTEKEMILFHQERYPLIKLQDHVKRIHQAVFGPGHLHDTKSRLDSELPTT